jgi:hypothetical protein
MSERVSESVREREIERERVSMSERVSESVRDIERG